MKIFNSVYSRLRIGISNTAVQTIDNSALDNRSSQLINLNRFKEYIECFIGDNQPIAENTNSRINYIEQCKLSLKLALEYINTPQNNKNLKITEAHIDDPIAKKLFYLLTDNKFPQANPFKNLLTFSNNSLFQPGDLKNSLDDFIANLKLYTTCFTGNSLSLHNMYKYLDLKDLKNLSLVNRSFVNHYQYKKIRLSVKNLQTYEQSQSLISFLKSNRYRIEALVLSGINLTTKIRCEIINAIVTVESLKLLKLNSCTIGNEATIAIANGALKNLTRLELERNKIDSIEIIANSKNLPRLKILCLKFNEIGYEAATVIADSNTISLSKIDLSWNIKKYDEEKHKILVQKFEKHKTELILEPFSIQLKQKSLP